MSKSHTGTAAGALITWALRRSQQGLSKAETSSRHRHLFGGEREPSVNSPGRPSPQGEEQLSSSGSVPKQTLGLCAGPKAAGKGAAQPWTQPPHTPARRSCIGSTPWVEANMSQQGHGHQSERSVHTSPGLIELLMLTSGPVESSPQLLSEPRPLWGSLYGAANSLAQDTFSWLIPKGPAEGPTDWD